MANDVPMPEEIQAVIAEAEKCLDGQTDAFELSPQLKEIRSQLLAETAALYVRWHQLGQLAQALSHGHSTKVQ